MRLTTIVKTARTGLAALAVAALGLSAMPAAAAAQGGLFAPVVIVNGQPVTGYELQQRERFLTLLNAPGDVAKLAEKQLIQDRLQLDAAKQVGVVPSDADVKDGMTEFAKRANMTSDQFVAELAKAGVSEQTFRDFVKAGVAWRSLVQQKFGPDIDITKADIQRALSDAAQQSEPKLLLSEIILPATPQYAQQSAALAQQIYANVHTPAAFAAAARQYSASNSAQRGGQIDWVPESNLPPQIGDMLKSLKPGQISPPVKLQNAIGLFLLRAVGETGRRAPSQVSVKYAQLLIPGGRSAKALEEAAKISARADTCDDLYKFAKGQPEGTLTFTTDVMTKVPGDIGVQLASLDANEHSTALTRGGNLDYLMLCWRRPTEATSPDENSIRQQLFNQRLTGLAENYLAELQADAFIRRP